MACIETPLVRIGLIARRPDKQVKLQDLINTVELH